MPTLEIARLMYKYKNAILRYNPRSYLDLEGQSVNTAIQSTIINTTTHEFALFNNGITMLSDETGINEKIGQKNKAQLWVKNPQIINGGQTSVTLSRIYSSNPDKAELIFSEKEVLLKVITLIGNTTPTKELELIDEISNATNKQTPVITADRFANEAVHIHLQHQVFERLGLLYERKRGEFSDGIRDGYVKQDDVLERNHFWRLFYTANGMINRGFQKKLFQRNVFNELLPATDASLDRLYIAVQVFRHLRRSRKPNTVVGKDLYGKVFMYVELFQAQNVKDQIDNLSENLAILQNEWEEFIKTQRELANPGKRAFIDKLTGQPKVVFNEQIYFKSHNFEVDLTKYMAKRN